MAELTSVQNGEVREGVSEILGPSMELLRFVLQDSEWLNWGTFCDILAVSGIHKKEKI